jgi:hypothetical protein
MVSSIVLPDIIDLVPSVSEHTKDIDVYCKTPSIHLKP